LVSDLSLPLIEFGRDSFELFLAIAVAILRFFLLAVKLFRALCRRAFATHDS
jgi:hypothetical protein